jgi:hypothetical protein
MAGIPIVWMPLLIEFHPQDLLAMGLGLGGLACVRRGTWIWAGVLLGLAVSSQQFALLILAPLLVVAPQRQRVRLLLAAVGTWLIVNVPMIVATSGRAWNAVLIGSGNFPSSGGTVLRELHPHGALLVVVSRVLPIGVSMVLAWWILRRIGSAALAPVPLVSLIAISLSLRLVFEQNLFGYYFMALAVCLVLLDVIRGRIRGELVAWVAVVTLLFSPVPYGLAFNARSWGHQVDAALPLTFMVIALTLIALDAAHRRVRWYLVFSFIIVVAAFAQWPPWMTLPLRPAWPRWLWQIILVGSGLALAAQPLISTVRLRTGPQSREGVDISSVPLS